MTLTLTLVRHGQTHYNSRQLIQGSCDSPITRTGRDGVRRTAQHLADRPFIAAYSSPSGRAVTTAVEILRHHATLRLVTDADLREYDFGSYERRPERELEAVAPWAELIPEILAGRHPGLPRGEHAADFMTRVQRAFGTIAARHDDGEVLVVGHGLALGAWLSTVNPGTLVALPNASITTVALESDGTGRVLAVGVDPTGPGSVATRAVPAGVPAAVPAGV